MKKGMIWSLILMLLLSMTACRPVQTDSVPTESEKPQPTQTDMPEESTQEAEADTVTIRFSREGIVTELEVPMLDGIDGTYRIATNPELFTRQSIAGLDVFQYNLWEGKPGVYYSVSYISGMSAEVAAQELVLQNDGEHAADEQVGGYTAKVVTISGVDVAMSQTHFYLIDHKDGCYMIETHFTMEMYEGLFPQMRALFDTFTIVE